MQLWEKLSVHPPVPLLPAPNRGCGAARPDPAFYSPRGSGAPGVAGPGGGERRELPVRRQRRGRRRHKGARQPPAEGPGEGGGGARERGAPRSPPPGAESPGPAAPRRPLAPLPYLPARARSCGAAGRAAGALLFFTALSSPSLPFPCLFPSLLPSFLPPGVPAGGAGPGRGRPGASCRLHPAPRREKFLSVPGPLLCRRLLRTRAPAGSLSAAPPNGSRGGSALHCSGVTPKLCCGYGWLCGMVNTRCHCHPESPSDSIPSGGEHSFPPERTVCPHPYTYMPRMHGNGNSGSYAVICVSHSEHRRTSGSADRKSRKK